MSNTDQQLDQYQQDEQNYHSPKIIEHNKRQHISMIIKVLTWDRSNNVKVFESNKTKGRQ